MYYIISCYIILCYIILYQIILYIHTIINITITAITTNNVVIVMTIVSFSIIIIISSSSSSSSIYHYTNKYIKYCYDQRASVSDSCSQTTHPNKTRSKKDRPKISVCLSQRHPPTKKNTEWSYALVSYVCCVSVVDCLK